MFNQYPYINLNDFNLDYILKAIKEMRYEVTNFVSINAIKYANPIQWDITSQYEKNTIVIDPQTGTAYISVAPVPVGVQLNRPEYWAVVFDLGSFVTRAAQNFTSNWESETTTAATFNTSMGSWLVWGDVLYKALTNITAGDTYVVNGNIEHITIEDVINAIISDFNAEIARIDANIGDLANLTTTDKTSVVNAINEIDGNVGDLANLTTTDKDSAVDAINEVNANTVTNATNIGDLANLTTTDKTSVVNAINEIDGNVGDLANLTTTDKTSVVNAINEIDGNVGDLATLTTTDKDSVVDAINEVNNAIGNISDYRICNVLDYGAVGDGVTDDTSAFNAAIADINANTYNALYIPTGNYLIGTLTPITTGCKIFGAGGKSVLSLNTGHGTIFDFSAWQYGELCNLTFKELDSTSTNHNVIIGTGNFVNVHDIWLDNVRYFLQVGKHGEGAVTGYMSTISNIFGVALKIGIELTGSRSVTYMHNISINSENGENGTAIYINDDVGIDTLVITDSIFQRYAIGIVLNQSDTSIISSNFFFDQLIFDGIYSRGVILNVQGKFYRMFVENTWYAGDASSNEFVLVQKTDPSAVIATIDFNNCRIPYCYTRAIWLIGAKGVTVNGCIINSYTLSAIAITDGDKISIMNNVIGADGANTPAGTATAILAGSCTNLLISCNNASGTAGVDVTGSSSYNIVGNLGIADATG